VYLIEANETGVYLVTLVVYHITMIKNIPSDYTIDKLGNVFNTRSQKYIKGVVNSRGYRVYSINNRLMSGHRLVAEAFIDNPNNLSQVNHKDGDKLNNSVDNLEWVTPLQNTRHAIEYGLRDNSGSNNPSSLLTNDDVEEIKIMGLNGVQQKDIAKHFNIDRTTVSDIFRNKTWKHVCVEGQEWLKSLSTKGERNASCKVSDKEVLEIRKRYDSGEPIPSIAKDYPIQQQTVRKIAYRQQRGYLTEV